MPEVTDPQVYEFGYRFQCHRLKVGYISFYFPNQIFLTRPNKQFYQQISGGELNQREGERGKSSQSWVKITNMSDYISNL